MLTSTFKLNDDKTEILLIGTGQQLAKINLNTIRVGNTYTSSVSQVKNLGCWFDSQMKLDTHAYVAVLHFPPV